MVLWNERNEVEGNLIAFIGSFDKDPLGFVISCFPWKQVGTDLEFYDGPDDWQRDILNAIKEGLITAEEAIQIAVASGHGVGKSALVAWIIYWAMSTCEDCKGVVTANTETQLKTKTWAELAKWHRMALNQHWFEFTATALYARDPRHERTWRIDMVPWSERNTEAFAGLHNQGKRVLLVFDEASAIPDNIWEVSEGALTDKNTEVIWCCFGNPTRNTGRFKECFPGGRFAHRWDHRQVDSRSAKMTNKTKLQKWVDDYGEDSDFVRVRVRGVFPRAGTCQLISQEAVGDARKRHNQKNRHLPIILSLDVARFGSNKTVPCLRQGRVAHIIDRWRGYGIVQSAEAFIRLIDLHDPDAIVVDEDGIGGGVIDILRARGYDKRHGREILYGFHGGYKAFDETKYYNRRAEVWCLMRDWFEKETPDVDDEQTLEQDLIGLEYGLDAKGRFQLETKDHMEDRGLESPDEGDALAMSFAVTLNARRKGAVEAEDEFDAMMAYSRLSSGGSWMN